MIVFPISKQNVDSSRLAAQKLKGKDVIEVAFFLSIPGMWKADYLFRRMQQDPHFHPYIVIIPYTAFKNFDKAEAEKTLRRTERFVQERGFEYVIPYDRKTGRWRDIRKQENPDIVFYTLPYKALEYKYFVYNFLEPSKNSNSKITDIPRYERYLFLIIDLLSFESAFSGSAEIVAGIVNSSTSGIKAFSANTSSVLHFLKIHIYLYAFHLHHQEDAPI